MRNLIIKRINYRYWNPETQEDVFEEKFQIQVHKDTAENTIDIEISEKEFEELIDKEIIEYVFKASNTLPKPIKETPTYRWHTFEVIVYKFKF